MVDVVTDLPREQPVLKVKMLLVQNSRKTALPEMSGHGRYYFPTFM